MQFLLTLLGILLTVNGISADTCNHDNVYRDLDRNNAYAFCSGLLATTGVNRATLVTPNGVATYPPSRITSACQCIVTEFHYVSSTVTGSKSITSSTSSQSMSSYMSKSTTSTSSTFMSSTSTPSTSTPSTSTPSTSTPSTSTPSTSTPSTSTPSTSTSSISMSFTSSNTSTAGESGPTLTGVNFKASISQASCYHLPTPTSSLQVSLLNTTGQVAPYLQSFFLDSTATVALYISVLAEDGKTYILDFSDPNKLAIVDGNGNAMHIDATGVHFVSSDCSIVIDITIDNFIEQIVASSNSTHSQSKRNFDKRTAEALFSVIATLTDQCGQPVTDLNPSLALGPSPCSLVDGLSGRFVFNCQFPGEQSREIMCEKAVQKVVDSLTSGVLGSTTGWGDIVFVLRLALSKLITASSLQAVALAAALTIGVTLGEGALAPIEAFLIAFNYGTAIFGYSSFGLTIIQALISLYNSGYPDRLKENICMPKHASEYPFPLALSAGNTQVVISSLSTAPTSTIPTSKTIQDPNQTACCSSFGTCGSYTSCDGSSSCICGTTSESTAICFSGFNPCTSYAQCSTSADCPTGMPCIIENCCGYGVCIDPHACSSAATKRWDGPLIARNQSSGVLTPFGFLNATI